MTPLLDAFLQADSVVQLLGGLAVAVGLGGPLVTWLFSGLWADHRRFLRLIGKPGVLQPKECRGPYSRAFLPFVRQGSGQLPLAPETIIRTVHDALDKGMRDVIDPLRLWSYLPLLLGLVGTAWSLRSLLQRQIGPTTLPSLTQDMSNALLGTILGVSGALVATLLQRVIVRAAWRTQRLAERYLFDVFGQTLPETRIKVQFDEQILDAIMQRTAAVVEAYRMALDPVAQTLSASATTSAKAAEIAQAAFAEVAEAVKDAKGLRAAAGQLADASADAVKAGRALEEQVPLVAKSVALNREVASTAQASMSTMGIASRELTSAVVALKAAVTGEPGSISDSTNKIAEALRVLNAQAKAAGDHVADLDRELAALRQAVSSFGDTRVEAIADQLKKAVSDMQTGLREGLASIPGNVAQEIGRLDVSTTRTTANLKQLKTVLGDVEASLQRALRTARELSEVDTRPAQGASLRGTGTATATETLDRVLGQLTMALRSLAATQQGMFTILDQRLPKPRNYGRIFPWARKSELRD